VNSCICAGVSLVSGNEASVFNSRIACAAPGCRGRCARPRAARRQ
jgi:hypothetical protein